MFTIHVQITNQFLYSDLDVYSKHMYYMGIYIYIVNKTCFYSNEVGGAFRGTRQGPVLEYLWIKQT